MKLNFASTPALSIIRAKPAEVNGAPRSEVNTNGDLGSCSRFTNSVKFKSAVNEGFTPHPPLCRCGERTACLIGRPRRPNETESHLRASPRPCRLSIRLASWHALDRPFIPPTPRLAIESYWRGHPIRADRLARALAARIGPPVGWTWQISQSRKTGLPATFRTPPAPYRERAYSLGHGFC